MCPGTRARAGFDLLDKRLEIGGFGAPASHSLIAMLNSDVRIVWVHGLGIHGQQVYRLVTVQGATRALACDALLWRREVCRHGFVEQTTKHMNSRSTEGLAG
jgi:hypothetical protein